MSKSLSESNPMDPQAWVEAPSEFSEGTGDLVGYWESASPKTVKREATYGSPPVTFTPLYVTLTDSDIDPEKTSTLIHCRLEAPCILRSANKDEGYVEFPTGSLFGIWAKPGMRELKKLANQKIWMRNGQKQRNEVLYFKEIGQQSPMVIFSIKWPAGTKNEPLRIREDYRDESLDEAAMERKARRAKRAADRANSDESEEDFLPF